MEQKPKFIFLLGLLLIFVFSIPLFIYISEKIDKSNKIAGEEKIQSSIYFSRMPAYYEYNDEEIEFGINLEEYSFKIISNVKESIIEYKDPISIDKLSSITTNSPDSQLGEVFYQISEEGENWYVFNGGLVDIDESESQWMTEEILNTNLNKIPFEFIKIKIKIRKYEANDEFRVTKIKLTYDFSQDNILEDPSEKPEDNIDNDQSNTDDLDIYIPDIEIPENEEVEDKRITRDAVDDITEPESNYEQPYMDINENTDRFNVQAEGPVGSDLSVSIDEDSTNIDLEDELDAEGNFSHFGWVNGGPNELNDRFDYIQIINLESDGDLEYDGTDVDLGTNYIIEFDDDTLNNKDMIGDLTFTPDPDENGLSYSTFEFKYVDDSGDVSTNYTFTINVDPVNDAPTFTHFFAGVVKLTSTDEDSEVEISFNELVSQGDEADIDGTVDKFIVTDVTTGTLKIGANSTSATPWSLGSNDEIDSSNNAYWTPDLNANGQLDMFEVIVEDNEGAESTTTGVIAEHIVDPVNDAPVLNPSNPQLTNINEDPNTNNGNTITSLVNGSISYVDGVAVDAIAIIVADNTNGQWQYNTGSGWNDITSVSNSNALLLGPTNMVRFVPNSDWNSNLGANPSIEYRAWDQTNSFSPGTYQDASSNGTIYAYSSQTDTASIEVTPVNDAPVLTLGNCLTNSSYTNELEEGEIFYFNNTNSSLDPSPGSTDCTIDVSDLDAGEGSGNVQLDIEITRGSGILNLTNTTNVSVSNNGSNHLTITGTPTNINSKFTGNQFSFVLDGISEDEEVDIDITLDDLGQTGSGGNLTDTDTFKFKVKNLIYTVQSSGQGYPYLDEAINNAIVGDTITVDTAVLDMDKTNLSGGISSTETTVSIDKPITIKSITGLSNPSGPIFINSLNSDEVISIDSITGGVTIQGITFDNLGQSDILFILESGEDNITIENCIFNTITNPIVEASDTNNFSFNNNQIINHQTIPILLDAASNSIISSNTFSGSTSGVIQILTSDNTQISGNEISNSGTQGIIGNEIEHLTITNNTFTNNNGYDIQLYTNTGSTGDVTIHYNRFMDPNLNPGLSFDSNGRYSVDARYNYWASQLGPRPDYITPHNSTGATVTENVIYQPWYITSTTTPANQNEYIVADTLDDNAILGHSDDIDEAFVLLDLRPEQYFIYGDNVYFESYPNKTNTPNSNEEIDSKVGLFVTKTDDPKATGNPYQTLVKFNYNPRGPIPNGLAVMRDSFYDVHLNNASQTDKYYIKLNFTRQMLSDVENSNLAFYYWNNGAWHKFKNTGANLQRSGGHEVPKLEGFVWANVFSDEVPLFDGLQIAAFGSPRTSPLPGGSSQRSSGGVTQEDVFPDIADNIFKPYITNLYNDNIIKGYSDGNYKPFNGLSRDEFSKIIVKAFGFGLNVSGEAFPDVNMENDALAVYVQTLKNMDVIHGFSDGKFRAKTYVTRGQAAKIITRALEIKNVNLDYSTTDKVFNDVPNNHTFMKYIYALADAKSGSEYIVKGYSDGTYRPDEVINRGQIAKIVDLARVK